MAQKLNATSSGLSVGAMSGISSGSGAHAQCAAGKVYSVDDKAGGADCSSPQPQAGAAHR